MDLKSFMSSAGEKFEVFRDDEKVNEVDGISNREKETKRAYIGFYPDADIKIGDWIKGKVSNNLLYIDDIKTQVYNGKPFQLKGYYLSEKEYHKQNEKVEKVTNIYNLYGANSRVNNQSTDQSINIVDMSPNDLFDELRKVLKENITDADELQAIREVINEMESSQNTSKFNQAYTKFITGAANHMTLISPFIPALSQMIQG